MKLIKITSVLLLFIMTSCGEQSKSKNSSFNSKNKSEVQFNTNSTQVDTVSKLECQNIVFSQPNKNNKNLWQKLQIGGHEFGSNNIYFVEDCKSLNYSPDKTIFLVRTVLVDDLSQNDFNDMEAPFIAVDIKNKKYANYFATVNRKILPLSVSNDKAEFINSHDFLYEDNIYQLSNEYLKDLTLLVKNNEVEFELQDINEYLKNEPLNEKNFKEYNDIAYYLSENKKNRESVFLLEKIINLFPNRVVAYLNLGDSYWTIENNNEAKKAYQKYISLMKTQGKDTSKIPSRVYDRIK